MSFVDFYGKDGKDLVCERCFRDALSADDVLLDLLDPIGKPVLP